MGRVYEAINCHNMFSYFSKITARSFTEWKLSFESAPFSINKCYIFFLKIC